MVGGGGWDRIVKRRNRSSVGVTKMITDILILWGLGFVAGYSLAKLLEMGREDDNE